MRNRWTRLLFLITALTLVCPANAQRQERDGQVLMIGQCYSLEEAAAVLQQMSTLHHDRESWQARRDAIRQGILDGARLDRMPQERGPLNIIRHSRREMNGYTIENIAVQTLPGFWLCGNLYMPAGYNPDTDPPIPGVLCPHGHNRDLRLTSVVQSRSAAMARMGCAVFAYDMVGYGDTMQIPHRTPQAFRLQTWNSTRALDLLCDMPFIDQDRLAITGCSGGGTQTFILAAIDDRLDLAMPICQVSARFYGTCDCETTMPIYVHGQLETNNVEIAACFAPRPLLMVSDGGDWTDHTPQLELPYVQRVYGYYDAQANLENAHLADEGHDYGPSKRAAVYRFIAQHFQLDLTAVQDDQGQITEDWFVAQPIEELRVFDDTHPRPADALQDPTAIFEQIDAEMVGN